MKIFHLLFLFMLSVILANAQPYRTQSLSNEIYTVEVNADGNKDKPAIIKRGSKESIKISFDRISDESYNRLRYNIYHCDADWKLSTQLSEMDYLDGFNDNAIEDHRPSLNTSVAYNHFNLTLPNRDVNFKISGNYVVEIYDENDADEILLTACFSVSDAQVNIGYKVSSNTDIGSNKGYQQLSLDVLYPNFNIRDPHNDLKVHVLQNNRLDTKRILTKASAFSLNKISYTHNKDLIFEAGNEYRRFELASHRYPGIHVSHIEYDSPHYIMTLENDKIRAGRSYSYDQDQNGRYYIRNKESDYGETEADYFITYFTIPTTSPITQTCYVNGDFTNNSFTENYKLKYDSNHKEYYVLVLLKQGLYNYQYLTENDGKYSTASIEGNYYQTENEYLVYVYYRPVGQRYDALISTLSFGSKTK